ncbi:MAG: glycosyltransferase family 2 protein [Bacteroidaceae bacterium]|nr:glycosyltransferase family 2 protein [Bacteroidaceae bacterium]
MAKKISILVPAYNEEKVLNLLYDELLKLFNRQNKYEWEILFVNDGSKDNTLSVIKELRKIDDRVSYVSLSRNFGKERAMAAGFDFVTGDCCIIMDADLQDPPELVDEMIKYWEEGYEDIYAKRRDRGKESWLRKHLSLSYYALLQKITKINILKNVGDFRLLDKRCLDALRQFGETERYTKGLFCWIGYKKKEILFDRSNRRAGKSSWQFFNLFNLAIDGITTFTTAPLRMATILGLLISLFSFIMLIFYLIKTIIIGDPTAGFPTLIIVILFLGGTQLLALGIIGEYLGKIFEETKNRPVYIADEYNGTKIPIKRGEPLTKNKNN